jgi:hypothetical protein
MHEKIHELVARWEKEYQYLIDQYNQTGGEDAIILGSIAARLRACISELQETIRD